MSVINYLKKEILIKIVYCGPGLSGKTTNLQWLNQNLKEAKVGKLISLATKTDRTLFFDLMAVSLGQIGGLNAKVQLFTTPGQVFYNSTRKMVLKGVDGLVFVADSQKAMESANIEAMENMKEILFESDKDLSEVPHVIQYNKRDLKDLIPVAELQKNLNPQGVPYFESSALKGTGISETFQSISRLTFKRLQSLHAPKKKKAEQSLAPNALQITHCAPPKVQDNGRLSLALTLREGNGKTHHLHLDLNIKTNDAKEGKDGEPLSVSLETKQKA